MAGTFQIGRYEVEEKLGSGGMAHVYLARDPFMKRQVAVKVMYSALNHDADFRTRFEREAQVIAALEHPHIVPVYDFGYHEALPFIVMRYMPGGSLKERLEDHGPLSLTDAARVIERMAMALDDAHQQGVVHRDFKPENILMDQQGTTFLADFGIVKLLSASLGTGGWIAGTPAYMAPEQIHGTLEPDGRADVYAMGITLFELLSNTKPYQDSDSTKLMMKHVLDPIPSIRERLPDLPPAVEEAIMRAMAKDREERYPTALAFSEAINASARAILSRRARKRWMADELADALDSLSEEDGDPPSS
jgi:serine/threonine-protein kinase